MTETVQPAGEQPPSSVYRAVDGSPTAQLRARGWRVAELGPTLELSRLLSELGAGLAFPGWYGRNLDAAWDCLGDLELLADEPGAAVVWVGWEDFAIAQPADWARLMSLFRDRAALWPPFEVWLTGS